jgi:hypothetical protein
MQTNAGGTASGFISTPTSLDGTLNAGSHGTRCDASFGPVGDEQFLALNEAAAAGTEVRFVLARTPLYLNVKVEREDGGWVHLSGRVLDKPTGLIWLLDGKVAANNTCISRRELARLTRARPSFASSFSGGTPFHAEREPAECHDVERLPGEPERERGAHESSIATDVRECKRGIRTPARSPDREGLQWSDYAARERASRAKASVDHVRRSR